MIFILVIFGHRQCYPADLCTYDFAQHITVSFCSFPSSTGYCDYLLDIFLNERWNLCLLLGIYSLEGVHLLMDYLCFFFHERYVHICPINTIFLEYEVLQVRSQSARGTASISPMDVWFDPAPGQIVHVSILSLQWFFAGSVKVSWKSDRKVNCQKTNIALMHWLKIY